MTATVLDRRRPPGSWTRRGEFPISGIDEAMKVREAVRDAVAEREAAADPDEPLFSSPSARAETALGELLLNGLRHGRGPVRAALFRGSAADGRAGWLLEVSDTAVDDVPEVLPPIPAGASPTPGGLGLPLALSLATEVGWYVEGDAKHVWALIEDRAPDHLVDALGRQNG